MTVREMEIKHTYSFMTLAPAILGTIHEDMKLRSIRIAEEVAAIEDIYRKNLSLSSTIPGLSSSAAANTYLVFEDSEGNIKVFAYEWLNADTIIDTTS